MCRTPRLECRNANRRRNCSCQTDVRDRGLAPVGIPPIRPTFKSVQDPFSAVLIQTEQNSKTQAADWCCAEEIALLTKSQSAPRICTVRATLKAIQHGRGSLICHLKHGSTTAQTMLGAVPRAAVLSRAVKIAPRIEDQSLRGIAAVRSTGE